MLRCDPDRLAKTAGSLGTVNPGRLPTAQLCSQIRRFKLTFKISIVFLIGVVFQWNTQALTNAQIRLAQDYFHSVNKTTSGPFAPPSHQSKKIKTVGTNLKAFGVPFKVNSSNESFIEVQLYLSRDMGKTWKFYGRQTTDRNDFPFQADEDGEYWFSLKTLDRDRRLLPEGAPQPELKIVVDTIKPTLDFRIEADAAGRVACRWNANDKNLSPQSLRISYQPIDNSGRAHNWLTVPVNLKGKSRVGSYSDQIAWWPETTDRQLNVAVEIRDIAGNIAQVQRQVVVPQSGWRHRPQSTAQITDSKRIESSSSGAGSNQPQSGRAGFTPPPSSPVQNDSDATALREQSALESAQQPPNVVCENGVCRVIPTTLIGSEVEYVAPPSPYDSQPRVELPRQATQYAQPSPPSDPLVWPSEPQKETSHLDSVVGTTVGPSMRPVPSLAPQLNPNQIVARPATQVPSNPGTMKNIGDQVVGESSTMGRTNQYRGLRSGSASPSQAPELLPGESASQEDPGAVGSLAGMAAAQWNRHQHSEYETSGVGFSNSGRSNSPATLPSQTSQSIVNPGTAGAGRSNAPLQIIGTRRFQLDYGIDAIDPSGVARVDLWITTDGRNWSAWGNDPDNTSPFPVEVEHEGRYGFRIVVHSKDGLTGQGPSTGDDADMWVLVDTTSPLTHITSVPYGRGSEAGRLIINYSVADEQITLRPITLAYSESPQGPWNLIGEGLRNENRYVWKPKSNVPDRIFLRIEALDKAGNVGIHVLEQAIDVSGLVPRGTIRGVTATGRTR